MFIRSSAKNGNKVSSGDFREFWLGLGLQEFDDFGLSKSSLDILLKAVNFTHKSEKKDGIKYDNNINRYEFTELLVRVAEKKYFETQRQ